MHLGTWQELEVSAVTQHHSLQFLHCIWVHLNSHTFSSCSTLQAPRGAVFSANKNQKLSEARQRTNSAWRGCGVGA